MRGRTPRHGDPATLEPSHDYVVEAAVDQMIELLDNVGRNWFRTGFLWGMAAGELLMILVRVFIG